MMKLTKAGERLIQDAMTAAAEAYVANLERQRDALLAACEKIVRAFGDDAEPTDDELVDAVESARAAVDLSRSTGGPPP